jgi:MSHA biogenesis protein MshE
MGIANEPSSFSQVQRQQPRLRMGDLLIQQNLITPEQLQAALAQQKKTGRRLGRVLIDLGMASEVSIARALATQLRVPFLDLHPDEVSPAARQALTESQARRLRALPLSLSPGRARVAVVDPSDWAQQDELARLLSREIEPEVVCESALLSALDRLFSRNDEISGLARELGEELVAGDGTAVDFGSLGTQVGAEDAPVVRLLQTLLEEAVRARASDIHIEPTANKLHIRLRIDGELHLQSELEPRLAAALALRLKLVSNLDIAEKRLPQDGRFAAQIRKQPVDIRLSTLPNQYGESVVMRLLVRDAGLASLSALEMPEPGLRRLQKALSQAAGLIVVTGPTGSGKTTTLYSALGSLDALALKIITAEDPVEYRLHGINQVQVNDKIGLTFSTVLRSALRQDPDAILLGEMRDADTVETGLRAALTGHLVLSTLHTNDAASTPSRLIDMGAAPFLVGMALQLVVAQRLLRRICEQCAEPVAATPAQSAWLTQRLGKHWDPTGLKRGRGCGKCRGTGFLGRRGIYEVLPMNEDMVAALLANDTTAFSHAALEQLGDQTLGHQAAQLAAQGLSTVTEAMRIGLRQLD